MQWQTAAVSCGSLPRPATTPANYVSLLPDEQLSALRNGAIVSTRQIVNKRKTRIKSRSMQHDVDVKTNVYIRPRD